MNLNLKWLKMETIKIYIGNPNKSFLITNSDPDSELDFRKDAEQLNDLLEHLPIGTVRLLFRILYKDSRINVNSN